MFVSVIILLVFKRARNTSEVSGKSGEECANVVKQSIMSLGTSWTQWQWYISSNVWSHRRISLKAKDRGCLYSSSVAWVIRPFCQCRS